MYKSPDVRNVSFKFCLKKRLLVHLYRILAGGKVSMSAHTCAHTNTCIRKIKVAICNHQVDSPFNLWPGGCTDDLQAKKRVWSYM